MNELTKQREQLEMCDEIIIDALKMRYQIVQGITAYKQAHDLDIVQPEEEARKMAIIEERLKDFQYKKSVIKVYESILYRSKRIQSKEIFNKNIFLIGFMGVGKSTISKALHDIFAMDVVEMDQIIAQQNGMSISEIFETYGEEYFRQEETNLLIASQSKTNMIFSCGGGVPMREQNVKEMRKSGKIVLLTAKPETILERVKNSHDRPLLENNKTVSYVSQLMEQRRPKYQAAADIVIETDGRSTFEICEDIIRQCSKNKES